MGTKFINHEINYCSIQLLHLLPSYFLNFVVHTSISIFLFVVTRDFPCPYIQLPNIIGWSRLILVPTYNWHLLIAGMWHQCTTMPHLLAAALPFGAPRCHILCALTLCNGARRCQLFRCTALPDLRPAWVLCGRQFPFQIMDWYIHCHSALSLSLESVSRH